MEIPDWGNAKRAIKKGNHTPLDTFIYNNEPAGVLDPGLAQAVPRAGGCEPRRVRAPRHAGTEAGDRAHQGSLRRKHMRTVVKPETWWQYQLQAIKAAYGKGEAATAAANFLVSTLPILPGQRVMDMGCGYGAVARRLAFMCPSVEVIGVDTCGRLIDLCRSMCTKNAEFYCVDMFRVIPADKYDVILILGAIVGMFTHERNQELLRVAANALAPGGTLVLQQPDPFRYIRAIKPGRFRASRPEGIYHALVSYDPVRHQSEAHFALVTPEGIRYEQEEPEFLRVYTRPELRLMLVKAGLPDVRAYGGMDVPAEPYVYGKSDHMIVMARAQEE